MLASLVLGLERFFFRRRLSTLAVLALVTLERTGAVLSLEVSDRGLSVLPLTQLETTSQVPDVRPAQR